MKSMLVAAFLAQLSARAAGFVAVNQGASLADDVLGLAEGDVVDVASNATKNLRCWTDHGLQTKIPDQHNIQGMSLLLTGSADPGKECLRHCLAIAECVAVTYHGAGGHCVPKTTADVNVDVTVALGRTFTFDLGCDRPTPIKTCCEVYRSSLAWFSYAFSGTLLFT